jgi:5-(carboxyamino)imidazole ribonucleotide mutase
MVEKEMKARVAILFESAEGEAMARHTRETLDEFGVSYSEQRVENRARLGQVADADVLVVFDTSADALSHAASRVTTKPALAVPVEAPGLAPLDTLRASTRGGAAVGSLAIGKAGAVNAALMAVAILANADAEVRGKLERFRAEQTAKVLADSLE